MAAIDDLIRQVPDENLRRRLQREAENLARQKRFGLVYEEHIPESVLLPGVAIRRGSTVARREGENGELFGVERVEDGQALCRPLAGGDMQSIPTADLVAVARFGEAVYPYLQPIDSISTADPSEPWHTLIEADNYHALQLLDYLYHGQVDCIYIDPPYNTGARDWKYNNDYVDSSDQYRHSKWLSMMEKRLRLAKRLLNPRDSVLIVTIDEKEYLHLGCLLEEMFPEGEMQMVTNIINAKGAVRDGKFSRVEEYIYVVTIGTSCVHPVEYNMLDTTSVQHSKKSQDVEWLGFRRREASSIRGARPNQFYPIFVDNTTGKIIDIGDRIDNNVPKDCIKAPEGCTALWPLKPDGTEMLWSLTPEVARKNLQQGYIRINNWNECRSIGTVQYLQSGIIESIKEGSIEITGRKIDNSVILRYKTGEKNISPKRVWNDPSHNAENYGTNLIKAFLLNRKFPFPKSLYAVHDTLRFFVSNKPDALILDFFAGSGTTLHAVNLLNKEDGGHRRCIMVTNNEVSDEEAKQLSKQGRRPGDDEWERLGIARYVTWPRTTCAIKGVDINNYCCPLNIEIGWKSFVTS